MAGSVLPNGWLPCDGQALDVDEYADLFAVIGTTYGGDGTNHFALPDLRSRTPIGAGAGLGLTPRLMGDVTGAAACKLAAGQIPPHTHVPRGSSATSGGVSDPAQAIWGAKGPIPPGNTAYRAVAPDVNMHPDAIGPAGSGQWHNNMMPYLSVCFMIYAD